jgi:prevent-host-death family protein
MTKRSAPARQRTVNIHEAKTQFSKLVEAASNGEEIIIARAGKPAARLVPLEPKRKIKFGVLKNEKFWMSEDFNDPLPDDLQALFEGR